MTSFSSDTMRGLLNMRLAGYPALTERETAFLELYLRGYRGTAIARQLRLSAKFRGGTYIRRIRRKFSVQNNVDLVLACVWFGFCEPGLQRIPAWEGKQAA